MAYDRVISDLNSARIGNVSYPVVHALLDATRSTTGQVGHTDRLGDELRR
jgi:hypothetical protein